MIQTLHPFLKKKNSSEAKRTL